MMEFLSILQENLRILQENFRGFIGGLALLVVFYIFYKYLFKGETASVLNRPQIFFYSWDFFRNFLFTKKILFIKVFAMFGMVVGLVLRFVTYFPITYVVVVLIFVWKMFFAKKPLSKALNDLGYSNVVEVIAEITTKCYLELSMNYKNEFKNEAYLLAAAGMIDAIHYIYVTKVIDPLVIRDVAIDIMQNNELDSDESKNIYLTHFIIKLATKILEIDTPNVHVSKIEETCVAQKELISKTIIKTKKNYTLDPKFSASVSDFMNLPEYYPYRKILNLKSIKQ